jgi:hypothetical protein
MFLMSRRTSYGVHAMIYSLLGQIFSKERLSQIHRASKGVWSMGSVVLQKRNFPGPDFRQVVDGVFSICRQEDIALFVGLARRIWLRWNDVLHGGKLLQPGEILL